jgi:hypothetical protein
LAEAEVAAGKEGVKLVLAIVRIGDRTAGSYTAVRPKGTTPLMGVVAIEHLKGGKTSRKAEGVAFISESLAL